MIGNLESTRDAVMRAARRGDPRDGMLNVNVVRLLALAVMVTAWRMCRGTRPGVAVPRGYRAWPHLDYDSDVPGLRQQLRLYVCPKAAAIPDDEAFPVGTALVVETLSRAPEHNGVLLSVFVMEKVSSLATQAAGRLAHEGWAYSAYDVAGREAASDLVACGICRLPLMR